MSISVQEALDRLANSDASGLSHDDIYWPGSLNECHRVLARAYVQQAALVPDLAMLVRRLCHQLRGHQPEQSTDMNPVAKQAMEFLRKHNLQGSPLK